MTTHRTNKIIKKIMIFTRNKKLNGVLTSIYNSLLHICDTEQQSKEQIKIMMKEYNREEDFNIYQSGCVLCSPNDIRELYKDYASLKRLSDFKIQQIYMEHIGYVCRNFFK